MQENGICIKEYIRETYAGCFKTDRNPQQHLRLAFRTLETVFLMIYNQKSKS